MDYLRTIIAVMGSALLCSAQPFTHSELGWPQKKVVPGVITNGLTLWLMADQGTLGEDLNPSTNNGTVLRWEDQGSGSLDVIGNVGSLPVWITNSLNGLPIVRFSSTQELTNETAGAALPITCFMVIRLSNSTALLNEMGIISPTFGGAGSPGFGILQSTNLTISSLFGGSAITNGILGTNFSLVAFSHSTVGSFIRVNGVTTVTGNTTTNTWIGWVMQADPPLVMEMAEIIRYENIVLSPAQVLAAELYLRNKWGL